MQIPWDGVPGTDKPRSRRVEETLDPCPPHALGTTPFVANTGPVGQVTQTPVGKGRSVIPFSVSSAKTYGALTVPQGLEGPEQSRTAWSCLFLLYLLHNLYRGLRHHV